MTKDEVEIFTVWSVSQDHCAELAVGREGMGLNDFEQYHPKCDEKFVRLADYERLRSSVEPTEGYSQGYAEQMNKALLKISLERDPQRCQKLAVDALIGQSVKSAEMQGIKAYCPECKTEHWPPCLSENRGESRES